VIEAIVVAVEEDVVEASVETEEDFEAIEVAEEVETAETSTADPLVETRDHHLRKWIVQQTRNLANTTQKTQVTTPSRARRLRSQWRPQSGTRSP
jgi:hypothetical protein